MTTTAHHRPAESRTVTATPGRLGAVCLVAGAALNTGQAVLTRAFADGDTPAAKLADVDRHPTAMLAMILGGALGVVLLLVGFQWLARRLAPTAPRAARPGAMLTFAGTLGFLGLHVLMLLTYAVAGMRDRDAAVAVLEHLDTSPVVLVVVAPFLLGMFGGVVAFTVALARTRSVPRWIPVVWGVFVPIDFAAAGQSPVDPHWLFLAGAVGIAVHLLRARATAVQPAGRSTVAS